MRLANTLGRLPPFVLLAFGVAFALGNLWYAATRSTIPVALQGRVAQKLRLAEKHPGVDDVYLLILEGDHRQIHVDRAVFDAVSVDDRIVKDAWSRTLRVSERELQLGYSSDVSGMLIVMPVAGLMCILLACARDRRAIRTLPLTDETGTELAAS